MSISSKVETGPIRNDSNWTFLKGGWAPDASPSAGLLEAIAADLLSQKENSALDFHNWL